MAHFNNGYALVIGIAGYPGRLRLPPAVRKDASDTYELLCSAQHCGYVPTNVRLLLDADADAAGIRAGLRWLAESATGDATACVFFSGHGAHIAQGPRAGNYLVPYDCEQQSFEQTAISHDEVTELLRQIKAQRLLVMFDSCHSGGIGDIKSAGLADGQLAAGLEEDYLARLARGAGRAIMASSRASEFSLILPDMPNSLFTHHLLAALRGQAHTRGDGCIRVFDVFDYVSQHVRQQAPSYSPQTPFFKAGLEDNFPIALYLGGKGANLGAARPSAPATLIDKSGLRAAMAKAFGIDELELLCADIEQALSNDGINLQVNLDMIGGAGKEIRIHRLIEYLGQRGHLSYLLALVRQHRPGIV